MGYGVTFSSPGTVGVSQTVTLTWDGEELGGVGWDVSSGLASGSGAFDESSLAGGDATSGELQVLVFHFTPAAAGTVTFNFSDNEGGDVTYAYAPATLTVNAASTPFIGVPMQFHSGFSGTITIGGQEVPVKNWTVAATSRIAQTDNSQSGGFLLTEGSGGKTANVTFTIDRDFDNSPFAAPVSILPGAKLTTTKLYERGTSGPFFNFPSLSVETVSETVDHGSTEMIALQVTCRSDGTFAMPGAITP